MLSPLRVLPALLLAALACSSGEDDAPGPVGPVSFASDVYPILLARCSGSACHGVAMGPFRPGHAAASVDDAYAATQATGLGARPVFERILARSSSEDPAQLMPPPYATPPCEGGVGAPGCLTGDELALIDAWVAQGAPP